MAQELEMAILGENERRTWNELVDATATSQLPSDIMIQIVSRLPIKSIIRFKSVKKTWYELFSSPKFVQNYTRSSASNMPCLLVQTHNTKGDVEIRAIDSPCCNPIVTNLIPPFTTTINTELVGCINGLICLKLCIHATSIVLWNPAIQNYFHLPKPKAVAPKMQEISVGFAYDERTDRYIIIRVVYQMQPSWLATKSATVQIYNTGTNRWKQDEYYSFPWLVTEDKCGSIIRGSPHWFAYKLNTERQAEAIIMWFDPSTEEFRYCPYEVENQFRFRRLRVGNEGERPVVFVVKYDEEVERSVVVTWRLDKETLHVEKSIVEACLYVNYSHLALERVLGFWRNGEMIVLDKDGKVLTYDPKAKYKKTRFLPVPPCHGSMRFANVCEYTPTLVPPSYTSA